MQSLRCASGGDVAALVGKRQKPKELRASRAGYRGRRERHKRSPGMWSEPVHEKKGRKPMSSIFYIIGVVVVVLIVLSFLGLR
jgi:hypothetical protein